MSERHGQEMNPAAAPPPTFPAGHVPTVPPRARADDRALEYAREIARLRVALADAIEEMHDMVAYVPSYLRTKWEYDAAIKQAEEALGYDGRGCNDQDDSEP